MKNENKVHCSKNLTTQLEIFQLKMDSDNNKNYMITMCASSYEYP